MIFEKLPLSGAFKVFPQRHEDERGYFSRTWCRQTFLEQGLLDCTQQASISNNKKAATLRGMHFQTPPHAETKLVRCARGAIFDVIVDIRAGSDTCGQYHGETLSAENGVAFYIPHGFAHGFLTLEDDCEVDYQMAEAFVSGHEGGFLWNDPAIAIQWPIVPQIINQRDLELPVLSEIRVG